MIAVTTPDGVKVGEKTITGNYFTETAYSIGLATVREGVTIDSIKIDGVTTAVADTITVPYTAQELSITCSVVTAAGIKIVNIKYELDVSYSPIRLVPVFAGVSADNYNNIFGGYANGKRALMDVYYNGTRVNWTDNEAYTYRISWDGGTTWSEYYKVSYKRSNRISIVLNTDKPVDIEVVKTVGNTAEMIAYHADIGSGTYGYLDTIVPICSSEDVVIDTTNHTITGTLETAADLLLYSDNSAESAYTGYAGLYYSDKWMTLRTGGTTTDASITSDELATAAYIVPYIRQTSESTNNIYGPTYTVNITIQS